MLGPANVQAWCLASKARHHCFKHWIPSNAAAALVALLQVVLAAQFVFRYLLSNDGGSGQLASAGVSLVLGDVAMPADGSPLVVGTEFSVSWINNTAPVTALQVGGSASLQPGCSPVALFTGTRGMEYKADWHKQQRCRGRQRKTAYARWSGLSSDSCVEACQACCVTLELCLKTTSQLPAGAFISPSCSQLQRSSLGWRPLQSCIASRHLFGMVDMYCVSLQSFK